MSRCCTTTPKRGGGDTTGCRYGKKQLHCDYIVTINNDAMPGWNDFMALYMEGYKHAHRSVVVPDVASLRDGRHQNF